MKFFEYRIRWWDQKPVTLELIAQKFFISKCDLKVTHVQQFPLFGTSTTNNGALLDFTIKPDAI